MDWNPNQYLRYERERTQPSRDLAARISIENPRSVLDLGCGPGNSTEVLVRRFPQARVVGGDSSDKMLVSARRAHPDLEFVHLDATGDLSPYADAFGVVFSNACLQWVPDHRGLIPRLMGMVAPRGQLAVQVPLMWEQVMYAQVIRPLVTGERWAARLDSSSHSHVLEPCAYPAILASCSDEYEMWQTTYWHRLPSHEGVIEWYRGSSLRSYLQQLGEEDAAAFLEDVRVAVHANFVAQPSGEVILQFPRLFWVATKGA